MDNFRAHRRSPLFMGCSVEMECSSSWEMGMNTTMYTIIKDYTVCAPELMRETTDSVHGTKTKAKSEKKL